MNDQCSLPSVMFNIWTGKGNNERRSIYVLQIYVNVQCEIGGGDKKTNEATFGIVLYPFCFFFFNARDSRWGRNLFFFGLYLFLQFWNEEAISNSSRNLIYVLVYKENDYLCILFCLLPGKIQLTAWELIAYQHPMS